MATERAQTAAELLEKVRADAYPDVPASLVEAVYWLEHARQSVDDRRPTLAELRDLIERAAEDVDNE